MRQVTRTAPPIIQPRARSHLWTILAASGIIAACSWVIALLVMLLVYSVADPRHSITWIAIKEALVFATVFSIVIGTLLTARWTWQHIRQPAASRARQWKHEDEDRRTAQTIGDQLKTTPVSTKLDGTKVHIAAFLLLQRHAQGLDTTRDGCTPATCTQAEWNAANAAFKTIGLKVRNKLTAAPDLNRSWPIWEAKTYLDRTGRLWARPPKGRHVLIA